MGLGGQEEHERRRSTDHEAESDDPGRINRSWSFSRRTLFCSPLSARRSDCRLRASHLAVELAGPYGVMTTSPVPAARSNALAVWVFADPGALA